MIHTGPGPLRFGEVATRWASDAGITNQVPGSSPRGNHRGRKEAEGTSSWEAEPKHIKCGAALIPSLSWSECRQEGVGTKLGQSTGTIRRLAGHAP